MGVVRAQIQTVEEIYRLVWTAVANKRPIANLLHFLPVRYLPYRLHLGGWEGQVSGPDRGTASIAPISITASSARRALESGAYDNTFIRLLLS